MRILVCGGRDYQDWRKIGAVLDELQDVEWLIHGGAKGADYLAGEWAKNRGIPITVFPADWDRHGRSAGPLRNARMLAEGKPDLVVAFPGGAGTANMVARSKEAGVRVIEVSPSPNPAPLAPPEPQDGT